MNEIFELIKKSEKILICGHIRPDGDCIGAAMSMRHICEKLGKTADAVSDAKKPSTFEFLPEYDMFSAPRFEDYDLMIAVDCADEKRLGQYGKYLSLAKTVINIDHHPTNTKFGQINFIDSKASSVCVILYEMLAEHNLLDKDVATMLYTGISTDTGHFMHANTDSRTFFAAARLSECGIDIGKINHALYCNRSLGRIKLTAHALKGIVMYAEGKIALMPITLDDLAECGCTTEDTEGLIDYASSIAGVCIAIAICEQEGGLFRVSLRSVSADVSAVAATFGGGGHKLASGCIIKGDRYSVAERVTAAAASELSNERANKSI